MKYLTLASKAGREKGPERKSPARGPNAIQPSTPLTATVGPGGPSKLEKAYHGCPNPGQGPEGRAQ